MAASKGVTRATWNLVPGEVDDASNPDRLPEEYYRQIEMDVHFVGGTFADGAFLKIDPLSGQKSANGTERFVHTTKCGIIVGTELLRSTDDRKEVTCAKCKK